MRALAQRLLRPSATIARLRAVDARAWRDLRLEALSLHPDTYGASHDDWAGRPLADFAAWLEAETVLGARVSGDLVGTAALDREDRLTGAITSVYVRRALRGQGIARGLVLRACDLAGAAGFAFVTLAVAEANVAAQALYASVGFRPTGQGPRALCRDGTFLDQIVMTRHLTA